VFFKELLMEAGIQCGSRRFYYGVQCEEKEKGEGMGKKGTGKEKLAALDSVHQLMNESESTRKLGEGYVGDDGHVVVVNEQEESVRTRKRCCYLKVK
jgi:hypothetical protein